MQKSPPSQKKLSTARWSKSTKAKECPVQSSSTYPRRTGAVYDHTEVRAMLLSLQPVFVVRGLKNNILGLPAIVALQLIHRVSSVKTEDDIRKMFPKVFSGLGMLGELYQTKLKEEALPHLIYAPRTIAIP